MSRDTYKDFHLITKLKQLLTETDMVGKSYFNHRKRKVSKISAGGRLRKNNQALSYLSLIYLFNFMNRFEKTVFYFPNFAHFKMAGHKMAIFAFLTVT